MRIYPNTSTKRQRVSPETHLLALRAGMNSPAARLKSLWQTNTAWTGASGLFPQAKQTPFRCRNIQMLDPDSRPKRSTSPHKEQHHDGGIR